MTDQVIPTTTDMVVAEMNQKTSLEGQLTEAEQARVNELANSIDMSNSTAIITFGSETQKGLSNHADSMLNGVKNKDLGATGETMNNLMVEIRGLGVSDLDPDAQQGFIGKLLRLATPVQKFVQKYEGASSQIEAMVSSLQKEQEVLYRDIQALDTMYDEALDFFDDLAYYIRAAEAKHKDVQENVIPQMQAEAEAIEDESKKIAALSEVKDMGDKLLDLERRAHDMKLTRQVVMQLIPQTRMIQQTDKGLCTKINSIIANTIPVWKVQMAQAVTVFNQKKATEAIQNVTDATNDMMMQLSDATREGNRSAREQLEQGIVSIETVKYCNENLIAQINESVEIAQAGRKARAEADAELRNAEMQLADTLKNAASAAVA